MEPTNTDARTPPGSGTLPGLGLQEAPTEIGPGLWQWRNPDNGYESHRVERTIAIWRHDARNPAARGCYVLGTNARRQAIIRRGPYEDDIDMLRTAIAALRPTNSDRQNRQTIERALTQRIHNAATALTLGPHVTADDGTTTPAERLDEVQAACDARWRWLEGTGRIRQKATARGTDERIAERETEPA